MKSNRECMKDVLQYIVNNTGVKIQMGNKAVLTKIELSTLISDFLKEEKYSKEDIIYNVLKCYKYQLIDASITKNGNIITIDKCEIYDITLEGEKFLNDKSEL